ncbi:MAG: aminopeptidase N [Microbacterium sp.]
MSSANLTRDETAARSAAISLTIIRVDLDLTSAPDAETTGFGTVTTLAFTATTDETWIDFIGERVDRVNVNGEDREVDWDGARIRVTGLAADNEVTIHATGAYSRSGEGLHRFTDPADGQTYLYTQYEPADSRRVMACFEQPDMKARYTFRITAPSGWQVLSNGAAVRTEVNGGTQTVEFAETLPLSSYITAVAAGPYARVDDQWTRGEQTIDLGVLVRASRATDLDADEIIEVTKQGLDFYTEAFDYPYPWGKYDQIFVPEYNLGAMENPGLVTFTESYVFRGASTVAQHETRADTILHEMAHMWFGDLVTMKWWDDLWLKESFADYMGAHASVAATKFTDSWVAFANGRKGWAYTQDQLPTTHPIVADIPDLEAAKLNFDGITYAKGASVLKQLVAYVGEQAFFAGARRYFKEHAFGNTTLGDLLAALEAASCRDLKAWSAAWLETTGVSTITGERGHGALTIVQTDPRPHRLAIGLFALDDGRLVRRGRVDVDIEGERTTVDVPVLADADLVLVNDGDLTYAKVRLDDRSLTAVTQALSTIDEPLARGLVWASLWNAVRDGDLPAREYLDIVARHAPGEQSITLLRNVLNLASFVVHEFVPKEFAAGAQQTWLEVCWQALRGAEPGGDAQLAWARAVGSAAHRDDTHAAELASALDGATSVPEGLPLDADLRWQWLKALATTGHADAARIDEELERDNTMSGRTAWITALAARPDAAVRAAAWESAWNDLTLTNDHLSATIDGFRAGGRRDLIAAFDDEYFSRLRDVWADRSIDIARRLVLGLFPDTETTDLVDAWLAQNEDAPGSLRRLVIEQRDHLARAIRVRAAGAQ